MSFYLKIYVLMFFCLKNYVLMFFCLKNMFFCLYGSFGYFLKSGFRFSRNAFPPSWASSRK